MSTATLTPLAGDGPAAGSVVAEWVVAVLDNLSRVEDLLDWLEAHGVTEREVTALADDRFRVRWRGTRPA